jgi:5'-3' exonuclease
MDFISTNAKKSNVPFSSNAQLAYVLPGSMLHIAPKTVSTFLKKIHPEKYPESYTLQWAFCRYLWEAHPLIPEISKTMLEQWEVRFDQ